MARFEVQAELELSTAVVQLVRTDHPGETADDFRPPDVFWIDLCVTPRRPNARARYVERWGAHRDAPTGGLIALPPNELLHMKSAGGRHVSLICRLKPDAVRRWLPDDFEWTDRRLEACLDIASSTIRSLLVRLAQELRHRGAGGAELAEAIVLQLSIELARYLTRIGEPDEAGGLAAWRLRVIDRRLAEPGPAPSLSELAGACNISVRQLTRGFRASRGCSIGDYIAQGRIETAKRRLATDESVKVIASSMGYASPSSFAYAFHRATGSTPRQFRTRVLRGGERPPTTE